jgi:acyl-CoA dehydrogenase
LRGILTTMPDTTFLDWPFFADTHRALARDLDAWCARELAPHVELEERDLDAACRRYVRALGDGGWLRYAVPGGNEAGGTSAPPAGAPGSATPARHDARALCLIRETLGRWSPLADFCFALQGLGTASIVLGGSPALRERWLPGARAGTAIGAFAISEAEAGSDLAAMTTTARCEGDDWILDGEKTWISNAGIADFYCVVARWPDGGAKAFVTVLVPAGTPGLTVSKRIDLVAPHPIGTLTLEACRVPGAHLLGEPGRGLALTFRVLDIFRSTVGAAALGFARRALDEAAAWAQKRRTYGKSLADHQMTRGRVADMAVAVDAMALLIYRAAWTLDANPAGRVTREAAMAKLYATETAQTVIDEALQLFGGRGLVSGHPVERLYREIRALRIYEGASEIQKLIIANQVLGAEEVRAARGEGA